MVGEVHDRVAAILSTKKEAGRHASSSPHALCPSRSLEVPTGRSMSVFKFLFIVRQNERRKRQA